MSEPKVDFLKSDEKIHQDEAKDVNSDMVEAVVAFFKLLIVDYTDFDKENAFKALVTYINKYDRILYAPISNEIYRCYDENKPEDAEKVMNTVMSNIDSLSTYVPIQTDYPTEEDKLKKSCEDTKKAILKIWDHINLAQQQYSVLKQSDAEYKEKFEKLISSYKENMTKDMSNQLLTMVSIFTALAFLVFGGIESLDNIFSTHGIPLLKLMCVGAVWGLCILNLIFVFLFCVGKLTKLNFKSTDDPDASIFKKYPVIWWTDLMLVSILLLCLWAYYIKENNFDSWFTDIFSSNKMGATIIGTIVILVIIGFSCAWLARKTSGVKTKSDKKKSS